MPMRMVYAHSLFDKRIYLAALFCCTASLATVNGQQLSIDSCYRLAVKNYPIIKQYDLIEKTKEYSISNAGKAYLPQVSLTAIEGYILGGVPGSGSSGGSNFKFIGIAQVNQTIWDGGATKAQKKIIEASAENDKASVDVSLYDIKSRINQLYFGILLIDEQLKQLEVQDTILSINFSRIQQLNENGAAYSTDLDEIRVEQLKLGQQRREFLYTRKGYLQMLSFFLGIRLDDQLVLQTPDAAISKTGMEVNRPELLLYKTQRNLLNAQAGMYQVDLMPKIGILGAGALIVPGISLGASKLSSIGVLGLSASWNISGWYKNDNEKKLTKLQLDQVNVQEETFLFNTRLQMTQTSANIEKQKATLVDDDEIVSLRIRIREGYQLKYNAGVSPLMDFLNATQNESAARAQKTTDAMQLRMSLYDYKTTSGN